MNLLGVVVLGVCAALELSAETSSPKTWTELTAACTANANIVLSAGFSMAGYTGSWISLGKNQVITITGNGAVIDAGKTGGIFFVTGRSSLTLESTTIQNGKRSGDGGAIRIDSGTLTVKSGAFLNNTASYGSRQDYGGAIFACGGVTTIYSPVVFRGNLAQKGGNDVYNYDHAATVTFIGCDQRQYAMAHSSGILPDYPTCAPTPVPTLAPTPVPPFCVGKSTPFCAGRVHGVGVDLQQDWRAAVEQLQGQPAGPVRLQLQHPATAARRLRPDWYVV